MPVLDIARILAVCCHGIVMLQRFGMRLGINGDSVALDSRHATRLAIGVSGIALFGAGRTLRILRVHRTHMLVGVLHGHDICHFILTSVIAEVLIAVIAVPVLDIARILAVCCHSIVMLQRFGMRRGINGDALRKLCAAIRADCVLAACLGASCILYCSPVHMGMFTLFVCSCIRDILGYPISNIRLPSNKNIFLFYRVRLGFRRGRTIILVTELDIIGRAINITTIQIVSNIKCLPLQFDPDRHIIRDCLSKLVFLFAALICIIPRNSSTFRKR